MIATAVVSTAVAVKGQNDAKKSASKCRRSAESGRFAVG